MREAGLPVELTVDGDVVPLSAGIDLSCYRIVQEALTNALRHAEAQLAQVRLTYFDEAIEIEVLDDGRGATAGGGLGQGQLGMRERVSLLGGELDLGPRVGGGYAVRARIPLERFRP